MNKYFIQLFLEESTVIIPNLGALTVTNEETGEIMFLPYLKFDDGKLASFIAKTEGVDKADAENTIAKFVREIQSKLDQGESYDIFEFGSFSKSSEGEIEFTSTPKGSADAESSKAIEESSVTMAISLDDLVEEVNNAESESTPEIVPHEAQETPEESVTDSKSLLDDILAGAKEEENPTPEPVIETPAEPKVEDKIEDKKEAPKVDKKKEKKPEPLAKKLNKKEIKENELVDKKPAKTKKKKGLGFYLLIFFLVAIIGGGVWGYLNIEVLRPHIPFLAQEDEHKGYKSIMDSEAEHIQVMKELSGMTDSSDTEEAVEPTDEEIQAAKKMDEKKTAVPAPAKPKETPKPIEKKPEPKPVVKKTEPKPAPVKSANAASPGGSYHVIVGSFSSAENANNLASKLKSEGFSSSTMPNGSMTMVSAGSFPNADEAKNFIDSNPNVGKGWVYHK